MTTNPAQETPSPVTVPTLQDRAGQLAALGWTGREAEWIALVALHTGVFTRSQWCHFFGGAHPEQARRFVRALIDKKLAIEDERLMLPGGAHAVLLTGKAPYRALGIPDVRHRRAKDAATQILMRRLLSLDYLIERPTLAWLPTEADKVQRFEALGIDRGTFPYRKYGTEGKPQIPRYFAFKLPIAVDEQAATFVYVDAGQSTDSELRAWGMAHAPLWAALRARTFAVHVVAVGTGVAAAERAAPVLKRWTQDGDGQGAADPAVFEYLKTHTITYDRERFESTTAQEIRLRVEAVNRWYVHDWNTLDNKIRSSIVEGVSVFLSMFDLPSVARVFCPAAPEARRFHDPAGDAHDAPGTDPTPLAATAMKGVDLPPLDALIESGKVLALNMPAGTNPALARAIGVMLKNAWLQSLLRRPATMTAEPGRYVRPAVFICDEYQAFASVGEDDPSGDEKAFALTRQCRVIPIVATQSISSLRSVLGSSEAWRTLLQTLRTRIFLSLSDEASAEIASKLCGQVRKLKATYAINETSRQSGINFLSAQAGGGRGSVGASKSFTDHREAVFQPRDFALLGNCQAICLPYDGVQSLPPRRVYLKPHYLPADLPYWHAKRTGQL